MSVWVLQPRVTSPMWAVTDRPLLSSDFFAATLIFLCHCLCFGAQLHSHR